MVDVSSFLVQFFSGSSFPVGALPRWLLPIALALPLTYGNDAVRGLLLRTRTILPLPLEVALLSVFMIGMVALGLFIFDRIDRKVGRLGTLGQH